MRNLRVKSAAVASKGGSTRFKVSSDLGLTWQTTASGNALKREVAAHLNELDISKIIDCLAVDCPYELYWYEKTAATTWQYGYSTKATGNKTTVKIENLSISMPVISSYASGKYKVNAGIGTACKKCSRKCQNDRKRISGLYRDRKAVRI